MPVERDMLVIGSNIMWSVMLEALRTLENTDGSGEVVDAAGGLQGGAENLDGGDEIVGEAVVQVALYQKPISGFSLALRGGWWKSC